MAAQSSEPMFGRGVDAQKPSDRTATAPTSRDSKEKGVSLFGAGASSLLNRGYLNGHGAAGHGLLGLNGIGALTGLLGANGKLADISELPSVQSRRPSGLGDSLSSVPSEMPRSNGSSNSIASVLSGRPNLSQNLSQRNLSQRPVVEQKHRLPACNSTTSSALQRNGLVARIDSPQSKRQPNSSGNANADGLSLAGYTQSARDRGSNASMISPAATELSGSKAKAAERDRLSPGVDRAGDARASDPSQAAPERGPSAAARDFALRRFAALQRDVNLAARQAMGGKCTAGAADAPADAPECTAPTAQEVAPRKRSISQDGMLVDRPEPKVGRSGSQKSSAQSSSSSMHVEVPRTGGGEAARAKEDEHALRGADTAARRGVFGGAEKWMPHTPPLQPVPDCEGRVSPVSPLWKVDADCERPCSPNFDSMFRLHT